MRIVKYCWYELQGWWKNPKIMACFAFLFLFIFNSLKTTREFARMVDIGVSPWLFCYLLTDPTCLLLIELTMLFLISDVFRFDQKQLLVLLRIGKTSWAIGQIAFLFVESLIFCLGTYLFSLLSMAPYLEWSMSWGKVIGTLAQTTASAQYNTLSISYQIMKNFSPAYATMVSFLILWLSGILAGEAIALFSILLHRVVGITVASVLVLLPYLIYFGDRYHILKFSPMSWCDLAHINLPGSDYPSITYVFAVLLVGIIIIGISIVFAADKKRLTSQEESA